MSPKAAATFALFTTPISGKTD